MDKGSSSDPAGDLSVVLGNLSPQTRTLNNQGTPVFLRVVKHFSPIWFTICMDTGVLGIILHEFPYPSQWTRTCSAIALGLEFVLFLLFGTLYLLRWLLYFKSTSASVSADSEEIALQVTPAITWLLLAAQIQLTCASSWGFGLTLLSYAMLWIGLTWILLVNVILYLHLVRHPSRALVDKWLPTAIFVPLVGMLSVGNVAGVLVNGGAGRSELGDDLAIPIIIVGFICVGFGLCLSFVMYSIYLHRLMVSGWPDPIKIPGMILTIGPCGQSASALLQLSSAAVSQGNFEHYADGFFLTKESAEILRIVCVFISLLLLGFAIFWMCIDYFAIIEGLYTRKIHPSLFWWSTIFPVGTIVSAMANIGKAMNSPAFKVLAVALFVFLLCIYMVNLCCTLRMTMSGELLGLPKHRFWALERLQHEHTWAKFPRKTKMT